MYTDGSAWLEVDVLRSRRRQHLLSRDLRRVLQTTQALDAFYAGEPRFTDQ